MPLSTFRLTALTDLARSEFDDIIDARSPAEFAEDHLPGAINLPVLDNDQRAEVGTIYKQVAPFQARKIGGALAAANIARHVAGTLTDRDGSWRPLVYCWRGGQRSGSFATILDQIGWRVAKLEGGWKSWRSLVVEQLEKIGPPCPIVVLDGNTGSAKTEILQRLGQRGVQIIDLEGLANHRGSLFGAMPGGQPSQKLFESRLATQLVTLDPTRPAVVEAESSKIGDLIVPRAMWRAICNAPRLRIEATLTTRAIYTARAYADAVAEPGRVEETVMRLAAMHPADRIASWQLMARNGDWHALAAELMALHYDPRYSRQRERHDSNERGVIPVADLSDAGIDVAAAAVEQALAKLDLRKD